MNRYNIDRSNYDIVKKQDGYYISRYKGFEESVITIPSIIDDKPIKGIARLTFKNFKKVSKIIISEGIEILEDSAFEQCASLKQISLPSTLKEIGSKKEDKGYTFYSTGLQSIIIPQSVEYIGPYTFCGCAHLVSVIFPEHISSIPKGAFAYCEKLKNIQFSKDLRKIEEKAFENCVSLKNLHIPIGTEIIEVQAFLGTELDTIYIPPSVLKIGDKSIRKGSLGDLTFGYNKHQLTIHCVYDSAAYWYAQEYNIQVEQAKF